MSAPVSPSAASRFYGNTDPAQPDPELEGSAAANNAFDTVELLEAILLEVDNPTLLLSRRVSRMFEGTIKGSVQLQRKLYFLPTPNKGKSKTTKNKPIELNPLLFTEFDTEAIHIACTLSRSFENRCKGEFSVIPRDDGDTLTVPSGSWQNMLVVRDGARFWFRAVYVSHRDYPMELPIPQVIHRKCPKGFAAGMLADWLQEEAIC